MKVMKPTIRETVVDQIELYNLDEVVDVELLGQHPEGDCWDYDWIHDYDSYKYSWKNTEHVPIDMLLKAVEKLKAEGASHVQIYPHGDHDSYYLTGVKLEVVPEEEVLEREKKKLEAAIISHKLKLSRDEKNLEESGEFLKDLQKKLGEL